MLFDENTLQEDLQLTELDFDDKLKGLRTGKVSYDVINKIPVTAYGAQMPLNSLARVVLDGALDVVITAFNKDDNKNIIAAIFASGIGGAATDMGEHVRLKFQPLTQEDRDETVDILGRMLEDFRIRVRQIRKDYMQKVKELKGVSEDEQRSSEKRIQDLIDKSILNLEQTAAKKEVEILSI